MNETQLDREFARVMKATPAGASTSFSEAGAGKSE